jgi:hypothetical protein
MITKLLVSLPRYVIYEECIFTLTITRKNEGVNICYVLDYVQPNSKYYEQFNSWGSWINPFNGNTQGFLWLYEQAETDEEFIEAINECLTFLKTNNLYETTK